MTLSQASHARTLTARPAHVRHSAFLLSALLCLAAHARAQTPTPVPEDDEVLTVRTDLVTVPVFVTDRRGARVSGLSAADFRVAADGRPVEISYFAAGASRVALLFALDASGSAREHIERQREAAHALLARFGSDSSAAVLAFADRPALALPFTADAGQVRAAFSLAAGRDRPTAIFDAALAAARAFDTRKSDQTERRIVLLLSDGLDTASTTRAPAVVAEARERGVSFYVIHFPLFTPRDGRLVVRRPSKGFRELAEQTGGQYFLLGDERAALDPRATYDLAPVFRAVADDLQSQYVLGFYAGEAARTGRPQRLEVRLNRRDSKLRLRQLREQFTLSP
jgi:Ca-activated chloride channel homolog